MKKYLFGLFAIALAVTFSAFTVVSKPTVQTFEFIGTSTADYTSILKWDTSPDLSCSGSGSVVCVINTTSAITSVQALVDYLDEFLEENEIEESEEIQIASRRL